jgi:hypothetical protein
MVPARTAINCSHTPRDAGTATGTNSEEPFHCTSSFSPHTPVRNIASLQKTWICESTGINRLSASVQGNHSARGKPAHNYCIGFDWTVVVIEPRAHFDYIFSSQIDHGVKQVRSGIKHESTASNFRNLSPGIDGSRTPALPDDTFNP